MLVSSLSFTFILYGYQGDADNEHNTHHDKNGLPVSATFTSAAIRLKWLLALDGIYVRQFTHPFVGRFPLPLFT